MSGSLEEIPTVKSRAQRYMETVNAMNRSPGEVPEEEEPMELADAKESKPAGLQPGEEALEEALRQKRERKAFRAQKRAEREERRRLRELKTGKVGGVEDGKTMETKAEVGDAVVSGGVDEVERLKRLKEKLERKMWRAEKRKEREMRRKRRAEKAKLSAAEGLVVARAEEQEHVDLQDVNAALSKMKSAVSALDTAIQQGEALKTDPSPDAKSYSEVLPNGESTKEQPAMVAAELDTNLAASTAVGKDSSETKEQPTPSLLQAEASSKDDEVSDVLKVGSVKAEDSGVAGMENTVSGEPQGNVRRESGVVPKSALERRRVKEERRAMRKQADKEAALELEKILAASEEEARKSAALALEMKREKEEVEMRLSAALKQTSKMEAEIKMYDSKMDEAAKLFEEKFSLLKREVDRLKRGEEKNVQVETLQMKLAKEKELQQRKEAEWEKQSKFLQEKVATLEKTVAEKDQSVQELRAKAAAKKTENESTQTPPQPQSQPQPAKATPKVAASKMKKPSPSAEPPKTNGGTPTKKTKPSPKKANTLVTPKAEQKTSHASEETRDQDESEGETDNGESEDEKGAKTAAAKKPVVKAKKPAAPKRVQGTSAKTSNKTTKPGTGPSTAKSRRGSVGPGKKPVEANNRRNSAPSYKRRGSIASAASSKRKSPARSSLQKRSQAKRRAYESDSSMSDSDDSDSSARASKRSKSRKGKRKRKKKRKTKGGPLLAFLAVMLIAGFFAVLAADQPV